MYDLEENNDGYDAEMIENLRVEAIEEYGQDLEISNKNENK